MPERSGAAPADYLAAERTFLAWIRTGLALMGFGFVVARFGLFLEVLRTTQPGYQTRPFGLSFWFGTALILLGVVVNALSAWSHIRLVRQLARGAPVLRRPSTLAVAVAVILAIFGLAVAIYLISVQNPVPAHPDISILQRSEA
jgi:putative membrane protein